MKLIALQSGHENITSNCNSGLRKSTGAPGEIEFTIKIRNRLSQILLSKKTSGGAQAFSIQLMDANYNCFPVSKTTNFDFFLAIHYEADTHNKGGGFITAPDPDYDDNNKESIRIVNCIKSEYFKHSGIEEHEEWITNAMTEYYMWSALSLKTACGIIECGVGQDPHDKVLLNDTDRISNAIARGICKAFNIDFDAPIKSVDIFELHNKKIKELIEKLENVTIEKDDLKAKLLISNQKIENVKRDIA